MATTQEVERNYEAFQELLPELTETHPGQCALLRRGELVEVFPTSRDARWIGRERFPDGDFSIQPIKEKDLDLGWYSHVQS